MFFLIEFLTANEIEVLERNIRKSIVKLKNSARDYNYGSVMTVWVNYVMYGTLCEEIS